MSSNGQSESLLDFFREVWDDGRAHVSVVSGDKVYFDVASFAHVLSRGAHPALARDPRNVVLMTPPEHHVYDAMTHIARTKEGFNKVFELADQLRAEK